TSRAAELRLALGKNQLPNTNSQLPTPKTNPQTNSQIPTPRYQHPKARPSTCELAGRPRAEEPGRGLWMFCAHTPALGVGELEVGSWKLGVWEVFGSRELR